MNNIVAFANLDEYDITDATILYGDVNINNICANELILVTEDVVYVEGGDYE